MNKFQWNLNKNSYIFIQEDVFENVWKMSASMCKKKQQHIEAIPHNHGFGLLIEANVSSKHSTIKCSINASRGEFWIFHGNCSNRREWWYYKSGNYYIWLHRVRENVFPQVSQGFEHLNLPQIWKPDGQSSCLGNPWFASNWDAPKACITTDFQIPKKKSTIWRTGQLIAGLCISDYAIKFWIPQEVDKDGLVQERRNSIANALGLRFSCTNPSK